MVEERDERVSGRERRKRGSWVRVRVRIRFIYDLLWAQIRPIFLLVVICCGYTTAANS